MSAAPTASPARAVRIRRTARLRAVIAPLVKAAAVAFLVVVITFLLGKAVLGDPGRLVLGTTATQQAVAQFNGRLGLSDPVTIQFGHYLLNLLHGRLGESYAFQGTSVWTLVGPALGVSASVAICTVIVSVLVSVPVGITAAARKRRVPDYLIRGASLAALSTPPAFVALVLILVVAVRTGLLPAGGWGSGPASDVPDLVLPVATLTIYLSPILIRVMRERAIVIFDEPYVEAAIARGMPRRSVVVRHVLPNCAGPLLTVLGANFGALLSGSIITDVIFGLPGLGQVLTSAAGSGDLPVLQGVALVSGILVTLANVGAEIGQRFVDPRLRA